MSCWGTYMPFGQWTLCLWWLLIIHYPTSNSIWLFNSGAKGCYVSLCVWKSGLQAIYQVIKMIILISADGLSNKSFMWKTWTILSAVSPQKHQTIDHTWHSMKRFVCIYVQLPEFTDDLNLLTCWQNQSGSDVNYCSMFFHTSKMSHTHSSSSIIV